MLTGASVGMLQLVTATGCDDVISPAAAWCRQRQCSARGSCVSSGDSLVLYDAVMCGAGYDSRLPLYSMFH
jgi:hypothetical protein